jgi:hypothetical protein
MMMTHGIITRAAVFGNFIEIRIKRENGCPQILNIKGNEDCLIAAARTAYENGSKITAKHCERGQCQEITGYKKR